MRIHKEGFKTLKVLLLPIVGVIVTYVITGEINFWGKVVLGTASFFYVFFLQFFRYPNRKYTVGEDLIVAPADGKVVVIEETEETEFFKDKRIQVSIFMSPLNVHVNRSPIKGKVEYEKYHPGKYLVAWHPKSSTENERNTVVFKNDKITVLTRQIAGKLARKIISYAEVGKQFEQNEDFGFIKLGSRVDIFLPLGTKLNVKLNQTVKGGQSIIASI